jgi:6-phosphogluconolactonase (cycloisomerase 2 family)
VASGGAGKFLFAANFGSNNVSGFLINSDGSLTAMSGSPFTAGSSPSDVTVDPSGSFVYVTNFGASAVSIFRISSNALTGAGSASTGTNPNSVVTTQ